jgi:hypothetical protein
LGWDKGLVSGIEHKEIRPEMLAGEVLWEHLKLLG